MDTVKFNELFNKVKHELVRFEYRNRFLNSYTFKRDDMIFTLDFDKLLKLEITPPYLPSVKDKGDVSNIDQLFTKEPPTQTPT